MVGEEWLGPRGGTRAQSQQWHVGDVESAAGGRKKGRPVKEDGPETFAISTLELAAICL